MAMIGPATMADKGIDKNFLLCAGGTQRFAGEGEIGIYALFSFIYASATRVTTCRGSAR
jgi:hypothetical protein